MVGARRFRETVKSAKCDYCRKKRIKCNGERPCEACGNLDLRCSYDDVLVRAGRRSILEKLDLEGRLRNSLPTMCTPAGDFGWAAQSGRRFEAIDRFVALQPPQRQHALKPASREFLRALSKATHVKVTEPPPAGLRRSPTEIPGSVSTIKVSKPPDAALLDHPHVLLFSVDGIEAHLAADLPETHEGVLLLPQTIDGPRGKMEKGFGARVGDIWPPCALSESDYDPWCAQALRALCHPVCRIGHDRLSALPFGHAWGNNGQKRFFEGIDDIDVCFSGSPTDASTRRRQRYRLAWWLADATPHNMEPVEVSIDGVCTLVDTALWLRQVQTLIWALLHPGQALRFDQINADWRIAFCSLRYFNLRSNQNRFRGLNCDPPHDIGYNLRKVPGFEEAQRLACGDDAWERQRVVRILLIGVTQMVDFQLWEDMQLMGDFGVCIEALGGIKLFPGELASEGGDWLWTEWKWREAQWTLSLLGERILDYARRSSAPAQDERLDLTEEVVACINALITWKRDSFEPANMPTADDVGFDDLMRGWRCLQGRLCCLVNLLSAVLSNLNLLETFEPRLQLLKKGVLPPAGLDLDDWARRRTPIEWDQQFFATATQQ